MYCAFHPTNAATAHCMSCNRPLCAGCDHRIKAQPFCEDCIVRGVEHLRRPSAPVAMSGHPVALANAPSPTKATLLSLVPGLGAVYNRQNLKALVHFIGTVGLLEIGDATDLAFFVVGGLVFFLYTVIDANRTARAISAGEDPAEDERRIKWLFARYKPIWGVTLVAIAISAVLASLQGLPSILTPGRLWAGFLFLAGGYMIFSYFRSLGKEDDEEPPYTTTPPRSVVSTMLPPPPGGDSMTAMYGDGRTTSHLDKR